MNGIDFEVGYYDLVGIKRKNVTRHFTISHPSHTKQARPQSRNSGLLRKLISQVRLHQDMNNTDNLEDKLEIAMNRYFNDGQGDYDVKRAKALEMMEGMNRNTFMENSEDQDLMDMDNDDLLSGIDVEMIEILPKRNDLDGGESHSESIAMKNQLTQRDSVRL